MQIKDSVALVTGGARGIGFAIARWLGERGAKLVLSDILEDEIEAAAAALSEEFGVEVLPVASNVADEASVAALYEAIDARFGRIDVAVLNAGIIRDGLLIRKDRETGELSLGMNLKQWDQVMGVNLTGVFLTGRQAALRMARQKSGVIIPISSVSRHGNAGQTNYSATKAGVATMTVVWAKELSRYGVRAACVAPGFIGTPMVLEQMNPVARDKVTRMIPAGRFGTPEEIASGIQFIIENDFVSGEVIEIAGAMRL